MEPASQESLEVSIPMVDNSFKISMSKVVKSFANEGFYLSCKDDLSARVETLGGWWGDHLDIHLISDGHYRLVLGSSGFSWHIFDSLDYMTETAMDVIQILHKLYEVEPPEKGTDKIQICGEKISR